jgi:hypothetical protein
MKVYWLPSSVILYQYKDKLQYMTYIIPFFDWSIQTKVLFYRQKKHPEHDIKAATLNPKWKKLRKSR